MNILVSGCLLGCACRYDGAGNGREEVKKLLNHHTLIPVCPEQLGGLPTPRPAAERLGDRVINCQGQDVTACFLKGAEEALRLAKLYHCRIAVLKERSPSCGNGQIYDGLFTGTLKDGKGVTAELLEANGIRVVGESKCPEICEKPPTWV